MTSSDKYIGTHNGKFHCDEVFGCWMLQQLPQFKDHIILRTRDPEVLSTCDIVLDVGGVFDHKAKRYDHHQREFCETMATLSCTIEDGKMVTRKTLQYNTKLSSAGLIYAFYGKEVIKAILNDEKVDDETVDFYYDRLYKHFVESVDAIDNGIKSHDEPSKYIIPVSLEGLVEDLNPPWNEDESPDVKFEEAMKVVGTIFRDKVLYIHKSWMPARKIVEDAVNSRFDVHESGRVIVLEQCCPWKQHFFMIEEEQSIGGKIVYAIYPGDKDGNSWRIQSVPVSENTEFDNRWPLPQDWRGVRDNALAEKIGIKTASFVHATGFIGGAKTKEAAILMADKAFKMPRLP
ncbi:unnamed protein product [Bursaphelenchus okinawaensis]|uniref:Uncharacterized protein n=1 Tax=Bursaphelenchus okinawaensis TaxID=465554 RepID=A0A811L3L7_9BILA|nr:unnamed protein product [Bursaphelenchus okinawaensis]CAG9118540.1 unnamed protein product [Bursaphelenchus okinawaensis]